MWIAMNWRKKFKWDRKTIWISSSSETPRAEFIFVYFKSQNEKEKLNYSKADDIFCCHNWNLNRSLYDARQIIRQLRLDKNSHLGWLHLDMTKFKRLREIPGKIYNKSIQSNALDTASSINRKLLNNFLYKKLNFFKTKNTRIYFEWNIKQSKWISLGIIFYQSHWNSETKNI